MTDKKVLNEDYWSVANRTDTPDWFTAESYAREVIGNIILDHIQIQCNRHKGMQAHVISGADEATEAILARFNIQVKQ